MKAITPSTTSFLKRSSGNPHLVPADTKPRRQVQQRRDGRQKLAHISPIHGSRHIGTPVAKPKTDERLANEPDQADSQQIHQAPRDFRILSFHVRICGKQRTSVCYPPECDQPQQDAKKTQRVKNAGANRIKMFQPVGQLSIRRASNRIQNQPTIDHGDGDPVSFLATTATYPAPEYSVVRSANQTKMTIAQNTAGESSCSVPSDPTWANANKHAPAAIH